MNIYVLLLMLCLMYMNVFNNILDTGIMPEAWLTGNIIQYNSIKSRIMLNSNKSDYFLCEIGVRQFSVYLHDLQNILLLKIWWVLILTQRI